MQQHLPIEMEAVPVEKVIASLRRLRVQNIRLEYDLQDLIAKQFLHDRIRYSDEHLLGPRNRIDFLIPGGIGVEVKKGKPNAGEVMAQVERYAQFDAVTALVIVVERNVFDYDRAANGKPIHYVALNKLWGISL